METNAGPTATLCRWACSTRFEDIPAAVREEVVLVLYDQIGAMLAAATLPACQPVVDVMRMLDSHGECSIVGHAVRTSVTNAALANGTIGHGDEVDSTGQQGTGHYAATIVPTVLSMGQHVGASGREFCRAMALGSEVAGRTQSILGRWGTREQFASSIGSTLGAAVSAGLLLGLDADAMEHALALAASGTCGLSSGHQDPFHQIKCLNHGRAAQAGVLSALLARHGYHGPPEVLTIENGFFDAFLGLPQAGNEIVEGLGEKYLMQQVAYKRYPVGGPDQTPLHALLKLIREHDLKAEDIEQIEVSVSRGAYNTVTTEQHPSVNMEKILSLAAVYREVTFSHIHDPRYIEDAKIKVFRERARIFIIPRSGHATKGQRLDTSVTVRARNGKVVREEMRYPLMTKAEIEQKFHTLAGLRLDTKRVSELERRLRAVESEKNVAALVRELEVS